MNRENLMQAQCGPYLTCDVSWSL